MTGERSPQDVWAVGAAYEPYVGRWSRAVAREFLAWLNVPGQALWLDVGCGTGALTETILAVASPGAVQGVDASDGFVAYAREKVRHPAARFETADAQSLPYDDNHYDAAVSGLVLNFVPKPEAMVSEMRRVVKPGGVVGLYIWDYAGEMQLMRRFWDAAVALDESVRPKDEGVRFPICQPEPLQVLFEGAGLQKVETRPIDVPTVFLDFEDYWSPFLGGQGPAPAYALSLSEDKRAALRDRIRAGLPVEADGSISLIARAWAVRGRVPN